MKILIFWLNLALLYLTVVNGDEKSPVVPNQVEESSSPGENVEREARSVKESNEVKAQGKALVRITSKGKKKHLEQQDTVEPYLPDLRSEEERSSSSSSEEKHRKHRRGKKGHHKRSRGHKRHGHKGSGHGKKRRDRVMWG